MKRMTRLFITPTPAISSPDGSGPSTAVLSRSLGLSSRPRTPHRLHSRRRLCARLDSLAPWRENLHSYGRVPVARLNRTRLEARYDAPQRSLVRSAGPEKLSADVIDAARAFRLPAPDHP